MTSINTNSAATTALRTLQQTQNELTMTQGRVSTGLKIGEAKDNAAYWSISTTLKSDNKSLATVKDALGLGAATVDVAYQGLNKAKDVLDEIKTKLTAATQSGVSKETIQQEISELQKQLSSIASSSVFSGENWLSVDTGATGYSAQKNVVSSFSRGADNTVSIGTIGVDTSAMSLYDATLGTKTGIIDTAVSLKTAAGADIRIGGADAAGAFVETGGIKNGSDTGAAAILVGTTGAPAIATAATFLQTGTFGVGAYGGSANTDKLVFNVTIDNVTKAFSLTSATGALGVTAANVVAAINNATTGFGPGIAAVDGTSFRLTTATKGSLSNLQVTGLQVQDNLSANIPAGTTAITGFAVNASPVVGSNGAATSAVVTTGLITYTGLAAADNVTFEMEIDGVNVTKSITLGVTRDTITIAGLLDTAFTGFADVARNAGPTEQLVFTSSTTGASTNIKLLNVKYTDSSGVAKVPATATGLPITRSANVVGNAFVGPFTLDSDDNISFGVTVDAATGPKNVYIDRSTVNAALSTATVPVTSGIIADATAFAKVVSYALTKSGVTDASVSVGSGANANKLIFTSSKVGADSKIAISGLAASAGADKISVDKIDISTAALAAAGVASDDDIRSVLSAYVSVVNAAINKVTEAAANLGSVSSRIELQQSFVNTLMDTIDKGVGNLIDADLTEESTRLQALQTKQQLGIQALSIANSSTQSVLKLFQ